MSTMKSTIIDKATKALKRSLTEAEAEAIAIYCAGKQPKPVAWANPKSQAAEDYATVCGIAHAESTRAHDAALTAAIRGD
jgi:hypothetical protein